jgi:prophage regulatory protein
MTGHTTNLTLGDFMSTNTEIADFDTPQRRLIRVKEVRELTGLSRSYIYSLSAEGLFPRSVPLVPGGTAKAWLHDEIMDWLEGRVAERDGGLTDEQ